MALALLAICELIESIFPDHLYPATQQNKPQMQETPEARELDKKKRIRG